MDVKIIEDQIEGLIEKGKELREKQTLFLKSAGVVEAIEKSKQDLVGLETDVAAKKEDLAELKAQKADAVRDTLISMQDKITELLPAGDGIVHINDDGSFIIGWLKPGKPLVPYEGLSGGEKVIFGNALGGALLSKATSKMLIIEGAEIDDETLEKQLKVLAKADDDTQIIVNTCHIPKSVPKSFNVIELK